MKRPTRRLALISKWRSGRIELEGSWLLLVIYEWRFWWLPHTRMLGEMRRLLNLLLIIYLGLVSHVVR